MKKKFSFLKIIFNSFLLFFFILMFSNSVKANEIDEIDIRVEIHKDGSATIKDHRKLSLDSGTEHYIPLYNLGPSKLLDFKVYEDERELERINNWDLNASIEEKSGKYGVLDVNEGIELCFGIGGYGEKEFTAIYKISDFVRGLEDGKQAVYWQFLNPGMDPITSGNIEITNDIDFNYTYPDTKLWGFGFQGQTNIEEKNLSLKFDGDFSQSDYLVALIIFPEDTFTVNSFYEYSSNTILEKAMDGAHEYIDEDLNTSSDTQSNLFKEDTDLLIEDDFEPFPNTFMPIMFHVFTIFTIVLSILFLKKIKSSSNPYKVDKEIDYYRQIPYKGDFIDLQDMVSDEVENWISAFILKWISHERLIDQVENTGIFFKKEKLALKINPNFKKTETTDIENELWNMIVISAGSDNILSEKEFNRYVESHRTTFKMWKEKVEDYSIKKLKENGYLETVNEKALGIFKYKKDILSTNGEDLFCRIEGFKRFLKDFSLVSEREVSHSVLWKDYMVWASFMGIAEEVYKQLKIANPNLEQALPYNYNTILLTHSFARSITLASQPPNNSTLGGGGSSFMGGGGGASGGGFGGGTR